MSAVDVDGQIASMAGLSRGGSRSGPPAGQDDGAFGAMMADMGSPPAGAPSRTAGNGTADADAASDGAAAKTEAGGLDELLSQVLAGTEKTEVAVTADHAEKGRKGRDATNTAALVDAGARAVAPAPDAGATASGESLTQAEDTRDGRTRSPESDDRAPVKADAGTAQDAAATQAQAALQAAAAQAATAQAADDAKAQGDAASADSSTGGAVAQAEAEAAFIPVDVPTMRVKVLSRETHFAPVRSWAAATEGARGADAETQRSDVDGTDAARSEAFAASPRERAAMRLEQARMQDATPSGSEGFAAEQTSAEADIAEGLLGGSEAPGSLGTATQGGMPLTSLRQVSSAIGAEVARMVDPSFVADADSTDSLARGNGPLRIIAIQLQPLDLGTVTVRMRLSDDGLDVRISASNPATARMLQQDQARLSELLQAQGIDAATVTVTNSSDQAAAWSRFEALPRASSNTFPGQGDGDRSSGQQQGQPNSGNGRDEGEDASGGRRSRRNSG